MEKRFNNKENTQPLQADYVKFIRWAQWRIEKNGEGVIGYVVRDSFLEGGVFRGMRQSLINRFQRDISVQPAWQSFRKRSRSKWGKR